jgi:hypothetical protein
MDENILAERISIYMKRHNLKDLFGSARSNNFKELSNYLYVENSSYSKQQRLHYLWTKSSLKSKTLFRLESSNKNKVVVKFSCDEWNNMIANAINAKKTKFLVKFHDTLSRKLQGIGFKCWLRNIDNRLKKKSLWDGKYHCIHTDCEISEYNCYAEKKNNEIFIHVEYFERTVSHDTLVKKLRVTGDQRVSQQYSLVANGILNTQTFNALYNSNINDPSKINLFGFFTS